MASLDVGASLLAAGVAAVEDAVRGCPLHGPVESRAGGSLARPRSVMERARAAAEAVVMATGCKDLVELLRAHIVAQALSEVPIGERARTLGLAIRGSAVVDTDGGKVWRHCAGTFFERVRIRVEEMLKSPPEAVAKCMNINGSVSIRVLFDADDYLAELVHRNPTVVAKAIASGPSLVSVGSGRPMSIRLLSVTERLRAAAEAELADATANTSHVDLHLFDLTEVLSLPQVQLVFDATSCHDEFAAERLECLRSAVSGSELLELVSGTADMPVAVAVRMRPASEVAVAAAEQLLKVDAKAGGILRCHGEVPLAWLAAHAKVQQALARMAASCSEEAVLKMLRAGFEASAAYALDSAGGSVRLRADKISNTIKAADIPTSLSHAPSETRESLVAVSKRSPPQTSQQYVEPRPKDVKQMRDLLHHYFQPFNLQHNRVLLAMVEARMKSDPSACRGGRGNRKTRKSGDRQGSRGANPVFVLDDLRGLPRIERIFSAYPDRIHRQLLELALAAPLHQPHPEDKNFRHLPRPCAQMPIQLCAFGSKRNIAASIEFVYAPAFRFIEARVGAEDSPVVLAMSAPEPSPGMPLRPLPLGAVSVASYCVSSDLSHSQSPKALPALAQVAAGRLDPDMLAWESRQQLILRQLAVYSADIVCIQGLQSIGVQERCSDDDAEWFEQDAAPSANHLVHLYRELRKDNYAVAFAPTLHVPGSDQVCFGNAIFWRRSRWTLCGRRAFGLLKTAACVELVSREGGHGLLVCSTKSAASYASDWADPVDDLELLRPLLGVHRELSRVAASSQVSDERACAATAGPFVRDAAAPGCGNRDCARGHAAALWCGDFGCEAHLLLAALGLGGASEGVPCSMLSEAERLPGRLLVSTRRLPTLATRWRGACASVLGEELPWTSVSGAAAGRAVDAILYGEGLTCEAVLGAMTEQMDLGSLLRAGYPSDHLLQLAGFTFADAKISMPRQEPIAETEPRASGEVAQRIATAPWRRKAATTSATRPSTAVAVAAPRDGGVGAGAGGGRRKGAARVRRLRDAL